MCADGSTGLAMLHKVTRLVMLYWAMGLAIKKITAWASKVSFQLHAFRLHDHRSAPPVLFADLYL